MRWLPELIVSALLFGSSASFAQRAEVKTGATQQGKAAAAGEVDLQRRHDALIQANGPGTDSALRDQLLAMVAKDQDARGFKKDGAPKDKTKLLMAGHLGEIDTALTAEWKAVVAAHGWPTIALVGIEASNGAMLILTHSRDHAWQSSLLPRLERLADDGKIDGSSLALVVDKELVAKGKPQRYGSQLQFVDGGRAWCGVGGP